MSRPIVRLADLLFPARDVGLATLVDRLSGPETGPHADNFVTNEDSFPRVCGAIGREVPAGGVYLGVGPDQNLTYLAHARPALGFILDFRRRNLLVHLLHRALFRLAADRVGYLTRLTARAPTAAVGPESDAAALVAAFAAAPLDPERLERTVTEVADELRPLGIVRDAEWAELATIQRRLAGPGLAARFLALPMYPTLGQLLRTPDRDGRPAHVLAAEPLYQTVHDLQLGDRVVPLVGDLAGAHALPALAGFLRERSLGLSLVYVSDVEFFLLRASKERFAAYVANLERLPRLDGARIVRTSTREIEHPERVAGDASTTVIRPLDRFLADAAAGRIRTPDDLFA